MTLTFIPKERSYHNEYTIMKNMKALSLIIQNLWQMLQIFADKQPDRQTVRAKTI